MRDPRGGTERSGRKKGHSEGGKGERGCCQAGTNAEDALPSLPVFVPKGRGAAARKGQTQGTSETGDQHTSETGTSETGAQWAAAQL